MSKKSNKVKRANKALREIHLSPELKACIKAANRFVDSYHQNKRHTSRKEANAIKYTGGQRNRLLRLSEAQNHRCCYCARITWHPVTDDRPMTYHNKQSRATIEHVLPKSLGGTDCLDNLVMACSECNTARGNVPLEQFMNELTMEDFSIHDPVHKKKIDEEAAKKKQIKKNVGLLKLLYVAAWIMSEDLQNLIDDLTINEYRHVRPKIKKSETIPTRIIMVKAIRHRIAANGMRMAA